MTSKERVEACKKRILEMKNLSKIFEPYEIPEEEMLDDEKHDGSIKIKDDAPPEAKEAYKEWKKKWREIRPIKYSKDGALIRFD